METYLYDFEIRRGASFSQTIKLEALDGTAISLSGKSVKAQIRPEAGSKTVLANFECTKNDSQGEITIGLNRNSTKTIVAGEHWYDVVVYNTTDADFIIAGRFIVRDASTDINNDIYR